VIVFPRLTTGRHTAGQTTAPLRRDLRGARLPGSGARLGLARARPGPAAVPARRQPLRGRAASGHRHRRVRRDAGARSGRWLHLLRRNRSWRRQDRVNPEPGGLHGDPAAPRGRERASRRLDWGGCRRRDGRSERYGRGGGALRPPRRPSQRRPKWVSRSAALPAAARACAGAGRECSGGPASARARAARGTSGAGECPCATPGCARGHADSEGDHGADGAFGRFGVTRVRTRCHASHWSPRAHSRWRRDCPEDRADRRLNLGPRRGSRPTAGSPGSATYAAALD
jgi:hypothetical protein